RRGADDRGDQHHHLPRSHATPLDDPGRAGRQRSEAVLLLQPLRIGRNRSAARGPEPRARIDRRVRSRGRPLARDAGWLRPARLLPPRLRLRLARARARRRARGARAGGPDEFLERYAVVLCSDHGQTHVERAARLVVAGARVTASNRAAMVYGDDPRALAAALDGEPSVGVAAFLDGGRLVARRAGEEDVALLDEFPGGAERMAAALRNPNAGEVLVSAA